MIIAIRTHRPLPLCSAQFIELNSIFKSKSLKFQRLYLNEFPYLVSFYFALGTFELAAKTGFKI